MDIQKKRTIGRIIAIALAVAVLIAGGLWAGTRSFNAPEAEKNATAGGVSRSALSAGGMDNAAYMSDEAAMTAGQANYFAMDSGAAAPEASGRKIVRSASVTLFSADYEADKAKITAMLEGAGGYMSDFYEYGDSKSGEARTARLSMRVPSEGLDAFLTGVEGIARVTSRSETATDRTVEYTDNESRINTLKAKLQKLGELLAKAESVEDIISIESAISDAQYQLDSYETQQRTIDRDVDMSDVTVTLREETPAQSAAAEDKDMGARLKAALNASLKGIGEFLRNVLVFIVMALPVIVPLAVAAVVVIVILRARRSRKAGK